MLELIILISAILVVLKDKDLGKFFLLGMRSIQVIVAVYCMYSTNVGPLSMLIGIGPVSTALYSLTIILISFDIEWMKWNRYLKEALFIIFNIFLISGQINVVLIMTLLVLFLFIHGRKSYFIDYLSLFLLSLISIIYFSELSTTVITSEDAYYLFRTTISELIFYPALLLFITVEYVRLWGLKREIRTTLVILPIILIYKLKFSSNTDVEIVNFLAPIYLVSMTLLSRKLLKGKRLALSVDFLFIVSLFTTLFYVILKKYEVAVCSTLVTILIFSVYRIIRNSFRDQKEIYRVVNWFVLINFAFVPVSYSGLNIIDLLSQSQNWIDYLYIFTMILISGIVFYFSLKIYSDKLYLNLLEATTIVKSVTASLFILSGILIYLNLSPFITNESNTRKLVQSLFDIKYSKISEVILSYNLNFIIFLVSSSVLVYFIKIINQNTAWRLNYKFDEILRSISLGGILCKNKSHRKSPKKINTTDIRSEVEVSSFKISFIILTIFLLISLVIVEL